MAGSEAEQKELVSSSLLMTLTSTRPEVKTTVVVEKKNDN